jgi:hypothetical protein
MPDARSFARRFVPLLLLLAGVAGLGLTRDDASAARFADSRPGATAPSQEVDVELILAVDISYSMDEEEQLLQRQGYMDGINSAEFLTALKDGIHGRIAIAYLEWAGANEQRVTIPWRIIDGPESAAAFTRELAAQPIRRVFRTSISGALMASERLFDESPYRGIRRVIDVSGDGPNNQGHLIEPTRDAVIAKGIVVNGLPLMLKRPNSAMMDIGQLDLYYEDCVIGGAGSFVVPVHDRSQFAQAIRTKLVLEVAGREPPARVMLAQDRKPRVSCTIGERLWHDRWSN